MTGVQTCALPILGYSEAMGWREGNPTLSKRRLLRERHVPIILPEHHEIEEMISASSKSFGAMIRAAWLTGCRQNELVEARWRNYNAKAKTLQIVGKGNKLRVIALSDEACAHIDSQPKHEKCAFIFHTEKGKPFAQASSNFSGTRRFVTARAAREGRSFQGFRFHDLRQIGRAHV